MKEMAYLVLMLFQFPLLRTLKRLCHRLVPASLSVYAPTQEIKTQRGMKIQIAYSKETYLIDQGMLS